MSSIFVALRPALAAVTMSLALVASPAWGATSLDGFTWIPGSPLTNELVTFTSTVSGATSHSWDLDDGTACDDASGPVAQKAFLSSGVYTVTLCVRDERGRSAFFVDYVTVRNRPPVAVFTQAPAAPLSGEEIVLTSVSADADGPIVSQSWDLDGDGAFDDSHGAVASVSFPAAGSYAVRLMVVDRDGAPSVALRTISVRERPPEFIDPFPVVRMVGAITARGTKIREFVVRAPAGARIKIRCRGRGCPAAKRKRTADASRTVRVRRFARRLLRPGTVVEIWVTKAGEIGKYTRFRIRSGKPPTRIDRCLAPGATRPTRC
jgi:hypothetical protein